MNLLRTLWNDLADLTLPRYCVGCAEPGTWLCVKCRDPDPSRHLRRQLRTDCACAGGLTLAAAVPYAGSAKRVMLSYKNRGVRALAPDLARWLLPLLLADRSGAAGRLAIVPVPVRTKSLRTRGFDHVTEICHRIAARLNAAGASAIRANRLSRVRAESAPSTGSTARVCVWPALEWRRGGQPQKELSAGERWENVLGAMRLAPPADRSRGSRSIRAGVSRDVGAGIRDPPTDRRVIIVDDVVTTGATLAEAHRALCVAGVPCREAFAVCGVRELAQSARR